MRPADFQSYRSQFRAILRQVLAEVEPGRLDEAAFPAYSHPNPMINALFWERLRKVVQYLEADAPYESVLDFGCGSGVLLPLLSGLSTQVTAADIDLLPLDRVRRHYPLPPTPARAASCPFRPHHRHRRAGACGGPGLGDGRSPRPAQTRRADRHLRTDRKPFLSPRAPAGRARILWSLPPAEHHRHP